MRVKRIDKQRFMEHDGKLVSLLDDEYRHIMDERLTGTMIPEYIADVVVQRLHDDPTTAEESRVLSTWLTDPDMPWENIILPRK